MATSGIFISVEGGEGVGKSTFVDGLVSFLRAQNIELLTTREPGGTAVANAVRDIFKNPPTGEDLFAETEALLVAAARRQHVGHVVKPALGAGKWVVCDRYVDSTRVYQGMVGGVQPADIEWLLRFATDGLLPHLTFLLDCDPRISCARIAKRRDLANRYDDADVSLHDKLRQGFLRVAQFYPNRFFILDASASQQDVLRIAIEEVRQRFDLDGHGK